jgi:hypothetical protein
MDQPKRDRIRAHAERAPLLGDHLRQAKDGNFGGGEVGLPDIVVEA